MVAQVQEVQIKGLFNRDEYHFEVFPPQHSLLYQGERYEIVWRNLLFENAQALGDLGEFIINNARFTRIHYVSADRIGPREFYPKQSFTDFPNVGRKGEFTANILSKKGQELTPDSLCLSASATNTVLDQAEAWLSKIFDGGKIRIDTTAANIVILSINSEGSSKTYKPPNVGFGYSYALPIIVSGLIARSGEILIVENPEAHLHPYAQSQLSNFLSRVSATGVQVFIESHSDHVLNGLRIAVLDQVVKSADLTVLYFDRRLSETIKQIPVESDGSIKIWPDGFFDQNSADFSRLFKV
jgi:predicted ATPase